MLRNDKWFSKLALMGVIGRHNFNEKSQLCPKS